MSAERQPERGIARFHPHEVYSFEALDKALTGVVTASGELKRFSPIQAIAGERVG